INAFDRDISLRGGFMYEECPVPGETVGPAGYQGDNRLYNIGMVFENKLFVFKAESISPIPCGRQLDKPAGGSIPSSRADSHFFTKWLLRVCITPRYNPLDRWKNNSV
ncbi:MAG: hypothetical protein KJN70_06985, partial [Eudoraea sp.]|nr:hypothetical protein [Eudoraea sp.]